MREIELADWKNVDRRVDSIVKSLEIIYETKIDREKREICLEHLFPTEDFLENDKLALVFMKIIREDYGVPIIVAERHDDYFILDGHHRAFVRKKLRHRTIKANVLRFPAGKPYREVDKNPLEGLRIKDVSPIEDPILKAWQRILFVVEHYEAIYHMPFYLKREYVLLQDIVPTQSLVARRQMEAIKKLLVPIVCIHEAGKCYILDGHARSLRARELGLDSIEAMIMLPAKEMNFGIVRTAAEMNLKRLEDIRIIE